LLQEADVRATAATRRRRIHLSRSPGDGGNVHGWDLHQLSQGETAGEARALFSELSAKLGADSVFMDVDNIAPGVTFVRSCRSGLRRWDVMLTLIGKDWMRSTDAAGRRRLDDTNDFVRREIRAALERNISVTPVLLQGAQMPAENDLPEDIRDLAYRNAFELSHTRWSSDIQELVKRLGLLKREPTDAERSQPAALLEPAAVRAASSPVAAGYEPQGWVWPLAIGMSVLVVATGGFLYYQHAEEERVKLLLAQAEADKRLAQTEAQLAAAKAEAASAAGAQAQRERERLEREAKELAAEPAAKDRALAEQLAKQRAAEQAAKERVAAEQLAKQRAAEQAAKERVAAEQLAKQRAAEQAAKERAAAEQLAKQRAVEQAAKEQIAQDKAASDQAVREQRARLADQERDRRMAEMRQGKFSGSLTVSLGDYATIQSIAPTELTVKTVMGACDKWSQQVLPNESRNFRAVCLGLPQYASQNGFHLAREQRLSSGWRIASNVPTR
jgi:chemotaxis protein histidine kinase CheA